MATAGPPSGRGIGRTLMELAARARERLDQVLGMPAPMATGAPLAPPPLRFDIPGLPVVRAPLIGPDRDTLTPRRYDPLAYVPPPRTRPRPPEAGASLGQQLRDLGEAIHEDVQALGRLAIQGATGRAGPGEAAARAGTALAGIDPEQAMPEVHAEPGDAARALRVLGTAAGLPALPAQLAIGAALRSRAGEESPLAATYERGVAPDAFAGQHPALAIAADLVTPGGGAEDVARLAAGAARHLTVDAARDVAEAAAREAARLPAPAPGHVRLYRAQQRVMPPILAEAVRLDPEAAIGRHFTDDLEYAQYFLRDLIERHIGPGAGHIVYVDVPEEVARASRVAMDGHHIIPREWAQRAVPLETPTARAAPAPAAEAKPAPPTAAEVSAPAQPASSLGSEASSPGFGPSSPGGPAREIQPAAPPAPVETDPAASMADATTDGAATSPAPEASIPALASPRLLGADELREALHWARDVFRDLGDEARAYFPSPAHLADAVRRFLRRLPRSTRTP